MPKLFSLEVFIKACKEDGDSEDLIEYYCDCWANECEGKTEEEMNAMQYSTDDRWMVEKEIKE